MAFPTEIGDETLLVVADGDSVRRIELRELLVAAGFRVESVVDEPALREAIAAEPPAGVLIDSSFAADGLELARTLRSAPGSRTPVLALIGRDELDRLGELQQAGIDDVIELPLHARLIEHRVRTALRQAELLCRLERQAPLIDPLHETRGARHERFVGELAGALTRAGGGEHKLAVLNIRGGPISEVSGPGSQLAVSLRRVLAGLERDSAGFELDGALVADDPTTESSALMFVPDISRVQDAARLGIQIREALVGAPNGLSELDIGIALFPTDGTDAQQLIANARAAAETGVQEGRSELRFHNEAMNRWSFERLALEQGLRDALEREELVVHYQPKLDLSTRRIVGLEALVRWEHPRLGMISPAQFIPLAEETGLIVPIGEWVLRKACEQNQLWQDEGLEPMRMAVNLSPVQFREPRLAQIVRDILSETGMDARWLELELTESMLMEQARSTQRRLKELKQAGIQLSIDDFGTGYSSLSYLRRFPIDTLKIDRSFVREVTSNADDAAIVTSIILMGKSLKLGVIAEGVETESQLAFLEVLGCDEIQGFLISPPAPADKLREFLIDWKG